PLHGRQRYIPFQEAVGGDTGPGQLAVFRPRGEAVGDAPREPTLSGPHPHLAASPRDVDPPHRAVDCSLHSLTPTHPARGPKMANAPNLRLDSAHAPHAPHAQGPCVVLSFDIEEHHRIEAAASLSVAPDKQAYYRGRMENVTDWLLEMLASK